MKSLQRFYAYILVAFVGLFAAMNANAGPSKADAQALVEKAAAFSKANGKDKTLAAINTKGGEFDKGELYVFVYDLKGTLLADPVNPALVGQNNVSKPDSEGKLFRKEIVDLANSKGNGWVDYKFNNPATGKVAAKSAYVAKSGDLIFIAGIYAE